MTPSVEPVSVDAIRQALDKILASAGFATSERLSRFLRFAVEEHLNGQTDKLKESFLGVELFGRKPSYDPRIDGVVRTEAVKLRARLKQYYDSDGRDDELIIDMPKGGYVPAFRLREKERAPLADASREQTMRPWLTVRWSSFAIGFAALAFFATAYMTMRDWSLVSRAQAAEVPAIAVLPFVDLSQHHDQGYFSDGVTEEITDSLSRTGGFRVAATTSSFAFKGTRDDIREIGRKLNVGLALEGSLRKEKNLVRVTAQLINAADGYHVWSETYERDLTDVFTVQDEISRAIVDKLRSKPR